MALRVFLVLTYCSQLPSWLYKYIHILGFQRRQKQTDQQEEGITFFTVVPLIILLLGES